MTTLRLRKQSLVLFSHILETASRGNLLAWRTVPEMICARDAQPESRFQSRLRDSQIVANFRSNLNQAEDLIGKLGHSLREITQQNY